MKITTVKLKNIIKEEIESLLNEIEEQEEKVELEPAPQAPAEQDAEQDKEDALMKTLLNRAGDVRTAWNNQTVKTLLSRMQTQFKIDNLQERVVATVAFGMTMGLNSQEEWNMLMKLARRLSSQLTIKDPDAAPAPLDETEE